MFQKINDLVVYVVAYSTETLNTRVKGVLSLCESFEEMSLVTKSGTRIKNRDMMIGALPNPLGLFRILGLNKIKSIFEKYIYFPSPNILYARKAIKILKKRINQDLSKGKRICLLTCVPPHDIAVIGLHLKSAFPEINWIVDWQDLWSYDEYYFDRTPSIYKKRLVDLEKRVLFTCNTNVTTNLKAKTILENHYNTPPHRVISINHHFNRLDLNEIKPDEKRSSGIEKNGQINVGFLGNLFKPPKVPGLRVVEAFSSIRESGFNVKLHIFGDRSTLARKAEAQCRNGSIIIHPSVSHKESLNKIAGCDFLLLALSDLPNCQAIMHNKLPHYLMLNKSIIAMVPENSAVADIIRETGSGYIIPPRYSWRDELKRILHDHLNGKKSLERNEREIEKYSWENIAKQWIMVIEG